MPGSPFFSLDLDASYQPAQFHALPTTASFPGLGHVPSPRELTWRLFCRTLWMGRLAVRWAYRGGRCPQEIPELMTQLLLSWGAG